MTKWFHKCDLGWLKARQRFLTATDVKELLPFTKTGRKRTVTDENYIKVLAGKLVNLTEQDCVSVGAAARGHVLEPYAIERFNKENVFGSLRLHHWDDTVVSRPKPDLYSLAFSPDAVNFEQVNHERNYMLPWIEASEIKEGIETIGEIKSYYPERHLLCGFTPKEELEERWQLATAMAVCDSIKEGYLLFYNPSMENQLFIVDYDRTDLADEIEAVLEVEQNWLAWRTATLGKLQEHYVANGNRNEEQSIIDGIMKLEELNPEGEKSVIR